MIFRTILQGILAASLMEFVPMDGAMIEQAAKLPVAPLRSAILASLDTSDAFLGLPTSADRYPKKIDEESLGIVTTAESVLVLDRESGLPLYQKNADSVRSIGSITKLMTALVYLERSPDLNAPASILPEDYRNGGRLYLLMNDPVTARDILKTSLVGSDNSATMTLVRLSGVTLAEFVDKMNAKAVELGMTQTTFADPTGLTADNRSTAYDIVRLLTAALAVPEIAETVVQPQVEVTQGSGITVTVPSTDDLLESFINQDPYTILGGKTGYLPEAGYCIGLGVKREGAGEIFVILLGSDSKITRVSEVKGLVDWAFRVFQWQEDALNS